MTESNGLQVVFSGQLTHYCRQPPDINGPVYGEISFNRQRGNIGLLPEASSTMRELAERSLIGTYLYS